MGALKSQRGHPTQRQQSRVRLILTLLRKSNTLNCLYNTHMAPQKEKKQEGKKMFKAILTVTLYFWVSGFPDFCFTSTRLCRGGWEFSVTPNILGRSYLPPGLGGDEVLLVRGYPLRSSILVVIGEVLVLVLAVVLRLRLLLVLG